MPSDIIKKLDLATINLIAAGEVIESPYNVVKELVENSIDAQSTNIIIEIKNGGMDYIRITDNGTGIKKEFVETAFEKHATSKIDSYKDFATLSSNGFRGEALFSISSISSMEMITKTRQDELGTSINIEFGKTKTIKPSGAKNGTTVIVEQLLENIPARKNFIKNIRQETSKITDLIMRYSISYPNIKFKLINNSKIMLQTTGSGKILDVIRMLYGPKYKNSIIPLDKTFINHQLSIQGALGDNSTMLPSRRMQFLFVNNRVIYSKQITSAIEKAYDKYILSGRFPIFFINIIIDPKEIDVNIHPGKLNIKFSDNLDIEKLIFLKITQILSNHNMIPTITDHKQNEPQKPKIYFEKPSINLKNIKINNKPPIKINNNILKEESKTPIYEAEKREEPISNQIEENKETVINTKPPTETPIEPSTNIVQEQTKIITEELPNKENIIQLSKLEYVGSIFDTYLILKNKEEVYFIDQHAAHERILYEKYLNQFNNNSINVQSILDTKTISIPLQLTEISEKIKNEIISFGFEADLLGDNIMVIRGIPSHFTIKESELFIESLLEDYTEYKENVDDIIKNKIATKACKAAIKGNDSSIKIDEINQILIDLDNCSNKFSCPHGRPITVKMTKYDMEKFFRRIV